MIRRTGGHDLEGVLQVLQGVGTAVKDPQQGFLMDDYTVNIGRHRQKYSRDLVSLRYSFAYLEQKKIKAVLLANTKEEWLAKNPAWSSETVWTPHFERDLLENFVLIDQLAMLPEYAGKGLGSELYAALFAELRKDGYRHVFAETIIAPSPNLASLNFRIKHDYQLAGVRFEELNGTNYTTLVYYKRLLPEDCSTDSI